MNAVVGAQAEQPLARDEETHFVLGMPVLVQKLGTQRDPIGMVGGQRDDVDRSIAALCLEPVDLGCVGGEDGIRRHVCDVAQRPLLEPHADPGQIFGNPDRIDRLDDQCAIGGTANGQARHDPCASRVACHWRSAISAATSHSTASLTRSASATSTPQA